MQAPTAHQSLKKRKAIIGITLVVIAAAVVAIAGVAAGIGIERAANLEQQREEYRGPSAESPGYCYPVQEDIAPTAPPLTPVLVGSMDDLLAYYDPDDDPSWVKRDDGAYYHALSPSDALGENDLPNRYTEFTQQYDDIFFKYYYLVVIGSVGQDVKQPPWMVTNVSSEETTITVTGQHANPDVGHPDAGIEWTTFIEVPRRTDSEGVDTVELVWE
jgi:hypothetical protein